MAKDSDHEPREPRFESCVAMSNLGHDHLALESGGYLYNSLRALVAAWLDASQSSRDGVLLNRSTHT